MKHKATGVERMPPVGFSFRRFFPCCPRLASARLCPPRQKSLENDRRQVQRSLIGTAFCTGDEKSVTNTDVFARTLKKHGRKAARSNRHGFDSRCLKALLFLALLLLLPCASCREQAPVDEDVLFVWYAGGANAEDRQVLAPEPYPLPDDTQPVAALLRRLFSGPEGPSLSSPFPSSVSVRTWELKNGVLSLDLSEEYSSLAGLSLTIADACIALTMTQLPGVDAVSITVLGAPVPFRALDTLTAADILILDAQNR